MTSDLLKNLERSIYTFNLHNINEICFNKVLQLKNISEQSINNIKEFKELDYIAFDNCIDKYLEAFKLIKAESLDKISNTLID